MPRQAKPASSAVESKTDDRPLRCGSPASHLAFLERGGTSEVHAVEATEHHLQQHLSRRVVAIAKRKGTKGSPKKAPTERSSVAQCPSAEQATLRAAEAASQLHLLFSGDQPALVARGAPGSAAVLGSFEASIASAPESAAKMTRRGDRVGAALGTRHASFVPPPPLTAEAFLASGERLQPALHTLPERVGALLLTFSHRMLALFDYKAAATVERARLNRAHATRTLERDEDVFLLPHLTDPSQCPSGLSHATFAATFAREWDDLVQSVAPELAFSMQGLGTLFSFVFYQVVSAHRRYEGACQQPQRGDEHADKACQCDRGGRGQLSPTVAAQTLETGVQCEESSPMIVHATLRGIMDRQQRMFRDGVPSDAASRESSPRSVTQPTAAAASSACVAAVQNGRSEQSQVSHTGADLSPHGGDGRRPLTTDTSVNDIAQGIVASVLSAAGVLMERSDASGKLTPAPPVSVRGTDKHDKLPRVTGVASPPTVGAPSRYISSPVMDRGPTARLPSRERPPAAIGPREMPPPLLPQRPPPPPEQDTTAVGLALPPIPRRSIPTVSTSTTISLSKPLPLPLPLPPVAGVHVGSAPVPGALPVTPRREGSMPHTTGASSQAHTARRPRSPVAVGTSSRPLPSSARRPAPPPARVGAGALMTPQRRPPPGPGDGPRDPTAWREYWEHRDAETARVEREVLVRSARPAGLQVVLTEAEAERLRVREAMRHFASDRANAGELFRAFGGVAPAEPRAGARAPDASPPRLAPLPLDHRPALPPTTSSSSGVDWQAVAGGEQAAVKDYLARLDAIEAHVAGRVQ